MTHVVRTPLPCQFSVLSLWWGVLLSSVKAGFLAARIGCVISKSVHLFVIKRESSAFPSALPVPVPDCLASCHRSRVFCHFTLRSLQTKTCPAASTASCSGKRDLQRCLSPSHCTHQHGNHLSLVWPGCQLLVSCGQTPVFGDCSSLFRT